MLAGIVRRALGRSPRRSGDARRRDRGRARRPEVPSSAPREPQTLKDLVVARGRVRRAGRLGAPRRLVRDRARQAVGLVGRNGSGKTTLLRLLSGIVKPTSGSVAVGGRVGSLLELGAGFHPDFTGRENVYLNGSIHGLSRARIREKFDEIVAFAELEELDRPAREDVLVGDVHAARLRDRGAPRGRRAAARRGVRRRRRGLPAQVLRQDLRVQAARRHDRVRLARRRRRSSGSATAPCSCARTAPSPSTGRRTRRSPTTAARWPRRTARRRRTAAARGAPARRASRGAARDRRRGVARPLPRGRAVRPRLALEGSVAAPRLRLELRDDSGLLVAGSRRDAPLGWDAARRRSRPALRRRSAAAPVRPVPPALALPGERRPPARPADAPVPLLVYPADESRGLVRLEGTWRAEPNEAERELQDPAPTGRP